MTLLREVGALLDCWLIKALYSRYHHDWICPHHEPNTRS